MSGAAFTQRAREAYAFNCFVAVSPRVWGALFRQRARRADESHPPGVSFQAFVGSRYSHGGEILVGVSFRVFIGSRYSLDGLAEPMNRVRPASASEFYRVALFARRGNLGRR